MKKWFFISLILIFNLATRFWRLGMVPPLFDDHYFSVRVISAGLGVITPLILYYYLKKSSAREKFAQLSSFIFSLLPSSIIESRIVSPVQFPLFLLLLFLLLASVNKNITFRLALTAFYLIILFYIYPIVLVLIWPLSNLFTLLSFDLLIFHNITFYWGGIREFGLLYLSFLPFLLLGFISLPSIRLTKIFIIPLIVIFLIAFSPTFPESRLFYLTAPFFSMIITSGILYFWENKKISMRLITCLLLFISVYELSQFLHHYHVHYKEDIRTNINKLPTNF